MTMTPQRLQEIRERVKPGDYTPGDRYSDQEALQLACAVPDLLADRDTLHTRIIELADVAEQLAMEKEHEVSRLEAQVARLQEVVETLGAAVELHAEHSTGCLWRASRGKHRCDCGLVEALELAAEEALAREALEQANG